MIESLVSGFYQLPLPPPRIRLLLVVLPMPVLPSKALISCPRKKLSGIRTTECGVMGKVYLYLISTTTQTSSLLEGIYTPALTIDGSLLFQRLLRSKLKLRLSPPSTLRT